MAHDTMAPMDIVSHGLYGGVAFGRSSKLSYLRAFFIGIAPDLFSFGILFVIALFNLVPEPGFGKLEPYQIPEFIHRLYNVTHSLVVASITIAFIWFVLRKHMVELFAWPLHILIDIPTHSFSFFPTPFLWPLSDFKVNGISWDVPYIFFSNLALLAVLYVWFYFSRRKKLKERDIHD